MKKTDLLVIGGSAGGILSALTARKAYGDIDITVIRDKDRVVVPCGIPYIYGTLKDTGKNIIPDKGLIDNNVNLVIDRVTRIDRENKTVDTKSGNTFVYKKLIIATGSLPLVPEFIPGHDLENVFPILKDENYLAQILEKAWEANDIVVIGGGFIGIEFAEQLQRLGKKVTLVEVAEKCLWQAFDEEFSDEVEDLLKEKGISVMTGTKVEKISGNGKVETVELNTGGRIKADLVILGMGVRPNTDLAREAGIATNERGAIIVDEYMRTLDPDIFAVGDCAEKKCFFTRKNVPVLLASTAATEAKIAGCNAFQLRLIRENKGTISAFSTKIFDRSFAAAGISESRARDEKFSVMTGEFSTMDKHPGSLPDAKQIKIKLVFSKCSGVLMGAQLSGGDTVGEMINILSLAIQKGITASELNTFQVATHPLLSASPIAYPINAAAMEALSRNCGHLNEDLQV